MKPKPLKLCVRVSQATTPEKKRDTTETPSDDTFFVGRCPKARWDLFLINPIVRALNELMLVHGGSWLSQKDYENMKVDGEVGEKIFCDRTMTNDVDT